MTKVHPNTLLLLFLCSLLLVVPALASRGPSNTVLPLSPVGCQFVSSPLSVAAFCDTFDTPSGTGNRSGDLNGTVWGVSRGGGQDNIGQNLIAEWSNTTLNLCGTSVAVHPENDVRICNGHIAEATNDGGGVTTLAMYPKQPFDIGGGRTGVVSFDVTDDSEGNHAAWPEWWYTDQPVPHPFQHESTFLSVPHNGVGIRFAQACGPEQGFNCGPNCAGNNSQTVVSVDSADVVTNYVPNDSFNGGNLSVQNDNCVIQGSAVTDTFNHIELHLNAATGIDVYGSDAYPQGGTIPPLRHLAHIAASLPLTRGVTWMEDAHYNGDKFNNQGTHTFYWDNYGFDGPVLAQDRSYDVLDNTVVDGGAQSIGWLVTPSTNVTLHTVSVDSSALAAASGAALLYGFYSQDAGFSLHVSINGHAFTIPYPFPDSRAFSPDTLAFPIPLASMVAGANTITFSSDSSAVIIDNVDLVAIGGGGSPASTPAPTGTVAATPTPPPTIPPTSTPVPTATGVPSPTPSPTPSPVPLNNTPCVISLNGTLTLGTCTGSFTP